jgi:hypothetical protein
VLPTERDLHLRHQAARFDFDDTFHELVAAADAAEVQASFAHWKASGMDACFQARKRKALNQFTHSSVAETCGGSLSELYRSRIKDPNPILLNETEIGEGARFDQTT